MLYQKTLAAEVTLAGIGLHTGRDCGVRLVPAPENHGITFVQDQLGSRRAPIAALWTNVVNTVLCTELRNQAGAKIRTIEHLMSAIRACNLDNVVVQCSDNEIPIMDGSAIAFINEIRQVGLKTQQAPRRVLKIRKPVRVEEGDKWVELLPHDGCRYDVEIEFENPAIGHQLMNFDLNYEAYVRDIASARTFGELKQSSGLHAAGLALGAGPSNTLIFDNDLVVSHEGKRFDDECIRHKILDAIGDLHLIGAPILGHFKGYKSGHKMHALLLQAVMASKDAHSWVTAGTSAIDDSHPAPMQASSNATMADAKASTAPSSKSADAPTRSPGAASSENGGVVGGTSLGPNSLAAT